MKNIHGIALRMTGCQKNCLQVKKGFVSLKQSTRAWIHQGYDKSGLQRTSRVSHFIHQTFSFRESKNIVDVCR